MIKNILNLEGAQLLTKTQQKNIHGGITKECADSIEAGYCVRKAGACAEYFTYATSGGCCCSEF